ncbi:centrosomal protein of 41 kDa isoform X2 [Tachysurus fulvidraco]|uniref:centrosomal protein of 41 kDa isoform X2 n=1 Tax=Tachysurus fulvidraco TaxID=1234273 RepID=UPI000F4FB126|nr:centrosomal protein of 41 kDa isoform X2 [Tachysurus fulvidraco]
MSSKRSIGNAEYLKKRIPQNPKYQYVKSRLDTGFSLTKYMERLEEMKKNYRYKKDELFKRLKVTTFAQLVLQVASVSDLNESMMDEEPRLKDVSESGDGEGLSDRTESSPRPSPQPDKLTNGREASDTAFSPRSTLQSVISGEGELDMNRNMSSSVPLTPLSAPCATDRPYPDCPYLLLDVRDRELYDQCHIISAHSFPIATLSRTINPYTKDVLDYRNVQGKIIILYDEDERIASQAATTMCQRGFENLFMLSGGLKVIAQKFPEGMTTGSFPVSCLPAPTGPSGLKHTKHRQMPQPAEHKQRFTSEDLNNIQHNLDEVLVPSETSSRLSSRVSISSANSQISSARSSRLGSGSARSQSSRPWK